MNMFSFLLSTKVLRAVCVLVTAIGFTSCQSTKSGAGSPYASSDAGGYNPYPGGNNGSLLAQNGRNQPYAEAPPPPPPGYDGPASNFQAQPSHRSSSNGSGSSKTKSKYSSSGGGSSSSKKGSSSGSSSKGGYVYSGGSVHTVRAGDTLYSIAEHNHTTVAKLKSLNHLKSGVLKVGQKIKVRG